MKKQKGGSMNRWFSILGVMLVLVLSGCAATSNYNGGIDFDETKKEQIIKGQSSKADILNLYGQPIDKGIDEKYNEFWVYLYNETQGKFNLWTNHSDGSTRVKKLLIIFDQKDIVQNYVYSDSTSPSTYKYRGY